jgi:hypothetical protein
VQQRCGLRIVGKVAAVVAPEEEVAGKQRYPDSAARELLEVRRQQQDEARGEGDGDHQRQHRAQALHAAPEEIQVAEATLGDLREDDRRDQVARDDEEHVDADVSAGHAVKTHVVQDHETHGEGAHAIDVRAVGARVRGGAGWRGVPHAVSVVGFVPFSALRAWRGKPPGAGGVG